MRYVGMQTQISRNNRMTLLLLLMFPLIILGVVWAFFALLNYFGNGYYDQYGELVHQFNAETVNAYFVNANATSAPGIVDADRNPILTRSEVYSGVYGRASISFYAFNSSGNKGIACGLNNLQKIRDGEPLGGHSRAEDDFDDDFNDFLD